MELTSDSIATRDNYFASCEAVMSAFANVEEDKRVLDISSRSTLDALATGEPRPAERVPTLKSSLAQYGENVKALISVANGYAACYSALDPAIKGKLASEQDVRFLNTLIDGVEQWKDVEVSWRIDQISEDLQQLIRENRKFIEIKQKQTLGVRDQEIKNWYQLLTGTAQVGYAGIVPTTDNLELRARTFAKGMMAAPNLSSSQLNCIGLAVYLATCCRKGSPFKLILFDDPIQSMDDEHTEAFKKQVINKLLAQDFQVILLTHMDNFADAVELLYRAETPLLYRMEAYTEGGPNLIWKGPEIKKLLNDIRKNKDSLNDGYRKQAVNALRQFVERAVKDIFTADTGNSIPGKYEDKNWTDLRLLLRQCPRFDSRDEPQLEDTHNFTSPYLHTDEVLAQKVPSPHQLNPHYESMRQLLAKYSDLLQLR